jgi:GTP-binding protein HflX
LNLLSDEKIKVEDKLFSTLSTTIRKVNKSNIPILITDTVGFIEKLPAWMINAFHSTLEEIEVADLVLLVVDVSDHLDVLFNKLNTSYNELIDIGVESSIIIVLNKIDLISNKNLKNIITYLKKLEITQGREIIPISAKGKKNVEKLLESIYYNLPNIVKFRLKLISNEKTQSLINWIYNRSFVSKVDYIDNDVFLTIECNEIMKDIIIYKCTDFNLLKSLTNYKKMNIDI